MDKCIKCGNPLGDNPYKNKCRECYNLYMREYMLKRYHNKRKDTIKLLGGQCVDCGSKEDLELDHKDSRIKEFDIAKIWSYSDKKFNNELIKCVLRCKDCHLNKSRNEDWNTVGHGEGLSGKKNCVCELCKAKKAEYMKKYNLTRKNNVIHYI